MRGTSLHSLIPRVETLLELDVDRLAAVVLTVVKTRLQNGMFHPSNFSEEIGRGHFEDGPLNHQREHQVEQALSEALNWLEMQGLLVPAAGMNGQNGWLRVSRKGEEFSAEDLDVLSTTSSFPKALLEPEVLDAAWKKLLRGEFDDAIFSSLKAVEEMVRAAGKLDTDAMGTGLMFTAFNKDNGPLTDKARPVAERQGLANLFAGAIGYYKNPQSHRTVRATSIEAQDALLLASHLIRIVKSRAV